MINDLYIYLFYYFIISYFFRFVIVITSSTQHPIELGEKRVRWIANTGSVIDLIHLICAFVFLKNDMAITLPNFLFSGLDFYVYWSSLSLIFLGFSIVVFSLMIRFSIVYLYRDTYYYKFFSTIYVLQIALCLLILTRNSEGIFIGWELLGLSSILLIAFYENQPSVLRNSLRILVIYKVSDVILYSVLICSSVNGHIYYEIISSPAAMVGLLFACLIKSSVLPWFWLPKAMEGPTPSTAVFYGGLATHVPVFIFMRVWMYQSTQLMPQYMIIMSILIVIAIICSSLRGKQINDAKNSIAYSAITQLGIIYLEVIYGFYNLAVLHCIIHGIYRTTEFLKAPSLIYNRYTIERNRRSLTDRSYFLYMKIVSKSLRVRWYILFYRELPIQQVVSTVVDNFMGLASTRLTVTDIKAYVVYSLVMLVCINGALVYYLNPIVSPEVPMLLIMAYILNVLSLINKYNPRLFFYSLTASVFASVTILMARIIPVLNYSVYLYFFVIVMVLVYTYKTKPFQQKGVKFSGLFHQSTAINMWILILGLSVTGMPGLGGFFLWERFFHALKYTEPALIISTFVLLTLDTIVFFRFYYASVLGKYDFIKQFEATYRF